MLNLIPSVVLRQYAAVIIANLTVVHLGLHIVWGSPVLIKFRSANQTILSNPPTIEEEAWIVSINHIVGSASLIFAGTLLNFVGRKRLLLILAIPRLVMCIICLFATEVWLILLARAVGAVPDMITLSVVSTYAAEVSGKQIRGASGTVTQISSATGMMIMFAVGPYVSYLSVNVMMTCIVVVTYIPIFFIPESPYFLYSKGRLQNAIDALTMLRGSEEAACEEIKEFITLKNKGVPEVDKKSLIKDKVVVKTFTIVIIISLGYNLVGYNTINMYLQTIFELAQTNISSEISSLIVGVIQFLASFCTFFLTDRFGRKPLLCISLIGLSIGMVGLGTFFVYLENKRDIVGFLNYLPLISVIFVIYGFNAGMGSLLWIVVAELFEGPARPYGVSCAMFVGCTSGFALTYSFPVLMNSVGAVILFYSFAGFSVAICMVIYFFVPETKGKSFSEIQTALGRKTVEEIDSDKPKH